MIVGTTHHSEYSTNDYNSYDHTKEKSWKLNLELNRNNKRKHNKRKNLMAIYLSNQVESNLDVDDNVVYTLV